MLTGTYFRLVIQNLEHLCSNAGDPLCWAGFSHTQIDSIFISISMSIFGFVWVIVMYTDVHNHNKITTCSSAWRGAWTGGVFVCGSDSSLRDLAPLKPPCLHGIFAWCPCCRRAKPCVLACSVGWLPTGPQRCWLAWNSASARPFATPCRHLPSTRRPWESEWL